MEDPKGLELFQEVLSKTKAGRIKWEMAASEAEYFTVLPGGFTLTVERSTYQDDATALSLRDESDRVLLRVSSDTQGVRHPDLEELYECARRQALQVDAKVDKLLEALTKL
jgi:hypothetical protein